MKFIDPAPLERTIAGLLEQLEALPIAPDQGVPDKYEKLAKAISVQMKAVQDIYAYNQRASEHTEQTKYLNYDNLPPPSPEDRARFIKRLTRLYNRINDGGEISSADLESRDE